MNCPRCAEPARKESGQHLRSTTTCTKPFSRSTTAAAEKTIRLATANTRLELWSPRAKYASTQMTGTKTNDVSKRRTLGRAMRANRRNVVRETANANDKRDVWNFAFLLDTNRFQSTMTQAQRDQVKEPILACKRSSLGRRKLTRVQVPLRESFQLGPTLGRGLDDCDGR